MPKRTKKSKKQVNISNSNIYPDLQVHSCPKYPVNVRPMTNPSISSTSRKIVLLKAIHDSQGNLNLNEGTIISFIFYMFGDVMGNVIHKNGCRKMWKEYYKLKQQNFNSIRKKVDANIDLEIGKTSYNKMNKANDSNINLENLNAKNNIKHIINPEQIVTQVVTLARNSSDINTKKLLGVDGPKIDSTIHNSKKTENNSTIDEFLSKPIENNSLNLDGFEESKPNSKYKGSRRKDKQVKKNSLLEDTSNIITQKGILKNEEANFYIATGFNSGDDDNILTFKNSSTAAYIFESKRKKNVRFNDNVVIIYYTSAECQQQAIRNGTFITSVVEPLKIALQQQQRNRELRDKHSYTHTIFPTAVRCGKS